MLDIGLYEELTKDLDEFYKAKAAVGEIRVWTINGQPIKVKKKANGTWVPLKGQNIKKRHFPKLEEDYGPNHSQYEGKLNEALEFLFKERKGQVIGAYNREDLGEIDVVWGDDNSGLRHIRKRHFIEQDDFNSYEEMIETISNLLKEGERSSYYEDGSKVDIKDEKYKVTLTRSTVYDREDNPKEKIWILTSFDYSRPMKEKQRKQPLTDEEIAFKKSLDHIDPRDSVFQHGLDSVGTNSHVSTIDSSKQEKVGRILSDCKSTLKKSLEQQFDEFLIQKARISYPIGTIKQFKVGGKMKDYIKTSNGWRPKNKGNKITEKVDSSEKENNRQETKENASEQKNGIKQIKQTYVKVDDGQIIIRMNKDKTRYKAFKGDFKVESNEGEDIVQFKKRIKEEYEKQLEPKEKENELEKGVRESLENGTIFDKIGSLLRMGLSEAGLKDVVLKVYDRIRDNSFDKEKDRVFEIRQKRKYKEYKEDEYNRVREGRDLDNYLQNEVREKLQDIPTEIKGTKGMYIDLALKRLEKFYSNSDRENILSAYSGLSEEEKLSLDKKLIEKGYQPIVNGLVYQNYEGNKSYKYFRKYEDALKFYKEDCSLSEEEKKLYSESWVRSGYAYINAVNTEQNFDPERLQKYQINAVLDKINDEIKASKISKMIEKSSLSENLVLTRYLSLNYLNKESQDLIFAKEGDVYEDLRFTAFGLSNDNELPITGDFKITLLAKKGQKVLSIGNEREVEYLCQRGSKFRVLKTGFSSIVVELLDE